MLGFLYAKEAKVRSKRVKIKNSKAEDIEYLINYDDFDNLPTKIFVRYETSGESYGFKIISELSKIKEEELTPEELDEYSLLHGMYSDLPVPKLGDVFEKMIDFINNSPDQSNIGGEPRHVDIEDLKKAWIYLLTDEKWVKSDESGTWEKKEVSRLKDFSTAPASTIYHDSQVGGLQRHTAKLIELAIMSYQVQDQKWEKHPLIIMIGALVHDIGKIDQYDMIDSTIKIRDCAKYRGNHIGIGLERWSKKGEHFLEMINVPAYDVEKIYYDIWHIIASHHGNPDMGWGSLVEPIGHDACMIYGLDYVESRQEESVKPVRIE